MNQYPNSYPVPAPEPVNFHNTLPGLVEPKVSAPGSEQLVTQELEKRMGYRPGELERPARSSKLAEAYAAQAAGDEDAFRRTIDANRHAADRTGRAADTDNVFGRFGAAVSGPNAPTVQFAPVTPQRQVAERAVNPSTVYLPLNGQLRTNTAGTVPQRPPVQNPTDRARHAASPRAAVADTAPKQPQATPEEWAYAQARGDFLNAPEDTEERDLAKRALMHATSNLLASRRGGAPAPTPVPAPAAKPKEEKFDWFGNAF